MAKSSIQRRSFEEEWEEEYNNSVWGKPRRHGIIPLGSTHHTGGWNDSGAYTCEFFLSPPHYALFVIWSGLPSSDRDDFPAGDYRGPWSKAPPEIKEYTMRQCFPYAVRNQFKED